MMTKNEYEEILVKIFVECKSDIIKNNELLKEHQKVKAKVLCIPSQEEKKDYKFSPPKYIIPKFGEFDEIRICETSYFRYENGKCINISGVNVLYYLVCMYLRAQGNKGIEAYYSAESEIIKSLERVKILKSSSFIFSNENEKCTYYPLSEIKGTGIFNFNIPPCI